MITQYQPVYKKQCLDIFDSNLGRYFDASERSYFVDYLESEAPNEHYFVLVDNDQVIACGGYGVNSGVGSLCWGMVHRDYHAKGVGTVLTEHRLNRLKDSAAVNVVKIETSQHTEGFYARHGFRTTKVTENSFGEGIDCVAMELRLK